LFTNINDSNRISITFLFFAILLLNSIFLPGLVTASIIEENNDLESNIPVLIVERGGYPGIVPSPEVIRMYKERGEEIPSLVDWADTHQLNPVVGERKVLTILLEFTDVRGTVPSSNISNLIYGESFGSMKHYFLTVSFGKLIISGGLATNNFLTEDHNMAYWGAPRDGHVDSPCIYELAKAAVKLADQYVNFKNFDVNNDGVLQNTELSIQIVHAGRGEESSGDPNDIWSHRWVMFGAGYSPPSGCPTPQDVIVDNVRVTRHPGETNVGGYTMQSEYSPMGTFAHEFGHDLGLPDLYDTDYSSDGVGVWCLMSYGSWLNAGRTPALLSAWARYKLGWVNPIELTSTNFTIPIRAATKSPEHSVYIIKRQTKPTEYFIMEYRSRQGYDSYLPGEGVLIWHVDDTKTSNSNENDRWVDLEEAHGGTQNLDIINDGNYGDGRDPFYNQHKDEFTPTTDPDSKWKDGTDSGVKIVGISHVYADVMFFDFELSSYMYPEGPLAGILNFDDYKNRMGSITSVMPSKHIIFPHFHQGGGWRTYISLVYPVQKGKGYPDEATVIIRAYDDNGNVLSTKTIKIPSMNKKSGFVNSSIFFGSSLSNKKGWIEIISDAPIIGLLNFENYPKNTLMGSVTGAIDADTTIYFPHFHQGGGWRSYISIVNTCDFSVKVNLRAYSATGTLIAETSKTIPARSKLSGFVDSPSIFGSVVTGKKGWIEVSGYCIAGLMNFDNYPSNTLMGSYSSIPHSLKTLVFPHFHQGGGWRTYISIVNVREEPVTVTLMAFSENGELLASRFTIIQPKSKYEGFVNNIFPNLVGKGWIIAYADKYNLVGLLNFDNYPTSTMMGSIEPCFYNTRDWETTAPGHIEFPHYHMDTSWRTYVSFIRLGGKDYGNELIRVGKLLSSSGTLVSSTTPDLRIGQSKWSGTISQLFGKTGQGWVAVRLSDNTFWD